jgi:hypothetical protein
MAQTGYTPISIYYSATSTNVPTAGNLVPGELAINTADGKLFYKDSSGVVQTIASKSPAAGTVLQVVTVGYGSSASTTSTSYVDTGLSATITPRSASNKILVIVSQGINPVGGASVGYGYQVNAGVQLLRGATTLITPAGDSGGKYSTGFSTGIAPVAGTITQWQIVTMNYLDSPASTSAQTYKTQFALGTSGMGIVYANDSAGGSYITLMEIAG